MQVASSSCPYGRYRLIKFLLKNGGEIETMVVEELLGCSKPYALELMKDLEILGVVSTFQRDLSNGGRTKLIKIADKFRNLLFS